MPYTVLAHLQDARHSAIGQGPSPKLLNAQTHLAKHGPLARLTESEAAEIETLQLVNATVDQKVAQERARLRSLIDSIHESQAVLRNRLKGPGKYERLLFFS